MQKSARSASVFNLRMALVTFRVGTCSCRLSSIWPPKRLIGISRGASSGSLGLAPRKYDAGNEMYS
ncbi:hypothetical protein D3C71_2064490 [compost metagenome]